MEQTVLAHGWDGKWFLRAYDAYGNKVGSESCKEGQIFIEPQGYCVMGGIGVKEGVAQQAMDSVRERLMNRYGIALHTPPYTTYHLELGEISSYPPGYKENGSIFCHNNPWITIAETVLGHGDRAFEVYKLTCPAYTEDQKLHRTEPYVYAQTIAGPYAQRFGEAKNSWLTGTAAWSFYSISNAILGVKPEYDGLRIDPCLPGELKELTLTRRFRGNTYMIDVVNNTGGEKTGVRLTLDGKAVEGDTLPISGETGKTYRVTAILG